MLNRIWKPSLMRQILILIALMLVTLLITYIITNRIAQQIIERKVTASVNTILQQVNEKMTSFDSDMQGISTFLFYSPTVQTYINTDDMLDRVLMNREVLSVFANTMSMKSNIRGIQLYDRSGKLMTRLGEGQDETTAPVQTMSYSGLVNLDDRPMEHFYIITAPIYGLDSNHIATEYRGTGRYVMDVSNLSPILRSAKVTANSRVMLLDRNDHILTSEGKVSSSDSVNVGKWKANSKFIVQSITLAPSGWKLISIIPKSELLNELGTVKRINITTYAIMFGILCMFLLIFFSRILKPIKSLMDFIKSYPKNGEDSRYQVVHKNEIGVLGQKLNNMLDDISELSDEVRSTQIRMLEIELAKKQMEISAFRNQINPHFLYNTLESIRAMAFYHNVRDIADISESLSRMFRYAVKGSNFVTIAEELAHIREYARIIDFRFRGRFKIVTRCEENLLNETMLKMLLQPLVENAVFHGLERKLGEGEVLIDIHRSADHRIHVLVQDNGYGMSGSQLQEIREGLAGIQEFVSGELGKQKGIGISNIYNRTFLFYGEAATLEVDSVLNEGTSVRISFPPRVIEGGNEHVSRVNRG
ncbi:sensor histidine kinase [Paenibacillus sp. ATY16]|uniref:cache domain-containing sensor histidine kinase n=1 Tax=Paenibacillus sp. ATY16 TaxID=1759312 RepID=UPI00200D43EC|nr:sensor histidine kinase [Paenibacillus sp. ATY16]MCK9859540.1 histidine kinase [Paenibacillus sp. ATY16]